MTFEPHQVRELAKAFAALSFDPNAKRSAHLQAGGFVWSDEAPDFHTSDDYPVPLTKFMIGLISYRTTLMRGTPHQPFTPYWEEFRRCCPTWPGFRAERCRPELIPELDREWNADFEKFERALTICKRKRERQ
jgi:hypothetical protein